MKNAYAALREMIYSNPLGLSTIKDKTLLRAADSYLPYSTGIEIECKTRDICQQAFTDAYLGLDLASIDAQSHGERRFRIYNGVRGMICLYRICELLKLTCALNPNSGIHYHIDIHHIPFHKLCVPSSKKHSLFVENTLKSLDAWKYKGVFNSRDILYDHKASWLVIRSDTRSLEFRIGEMTFDYQLIMKRILHCQAITKHYTELCLANK